MPTQLARLYLLHVERRLMNMLGGGQQEGQPAVSASSLQVVANLLEGKAKTDYRMVWILRGREYMWNIVTFV